MTATELRVRMETRAGLAVAWLRLLAILVPPLTLVFGRARMERTVAFGVRFSRRLIRWRLDGGRWRWGL